MRSLDYSSIFIRLFACVFMMGISLYAYIYKQNELTELRLAIPALAKELRNIQEENHRLKYEIDYFESPIHLMELMRMPEFGHLKFAYNQDVIVLPGHKPLSGKDLIDLQEIIEP
ncbi:MAG: hypothetical protein BGO14_07555 [Chlamydiales bacterium 38-26]|nr:hypothetical protein [Chlamydiales bacterium]OJV10856.1 MAG: hypothetical protein BGO14_07555 [Chlamydiales bacterium 38-26]